MVHFLTAPPSRPLVYFSAAVYTLTTTGYSTVSYSGWGSFWWLLLFGLMLIGGGTSSTAGGIKQFRAYLLAKAVGWEVKRMLSPRSVLMERPIWEGSRRTFVDDGRVRQVATFVFLYLVLFFSGSLILTASGYSVSDSIFEFASAMGTVGLSVGVTSATMPDAALWAEIVAMYVGRLEIFVVIASVWKIGRDSRIMLTGGTREKKYV